MNNQDAVDPRLQQLYRQLPKEQPSTEIDAKILAAAKEATKKPSRWLMPFSMAASVVLVSSLVLYLAKQSQQLEQAITPLASQQRMTESKAVAPAPINDAMTVNNSDILLGGSSSPYPQTERATSSEKVKSSATVAMDEQMSDELTDARLDSHQNSVANQAKEIKEKVANIASSPQPVLLKQDSPERQESDKRLSLEEINQPIVVDSAIPEQRALVAAPPMSAGAIAPLAKMKAEKKEVFGKAKRVPTKSIAFVIEGISFGMSREQLLAVGFICQTNVCSKVLNPTQQVDYWGIPASQALLKVLLQDDKVAQFVFVPQVNINTVIQAIEPIGIAADKVCDEQNNATLKRVVNGYLLQVYQQEKSVNVVICAEK
jgi:hypothetical protein